MIFLMFLFWANIYNKVNKKKVFLKKYVIFY